MKPRNKSSFGQARPADGLNMNWGNASIAYPLSTKIYKEKIILFHHFEVKAPDLLLRHPAVHSSCPFGSRFPHAPRFAPARAGSLPKSRCLTPVRHFQPFLGSPLPFGAFRTLKDQSVQPDSWPESSPSERSRLPITPQHRVCFISSMPDHRSSPRVLRSRRSRITPRSTLGLLRFLRIAPHSAASAPRCPPI
jgi:hypothetical protein